MAPIIEVRNLAKQYVLGSSVYKHDTFMEFIERGLRRSWDNLRGKGSVDANANSGTIWALRDINFDVQRGEIIGVIGANGAGKTTLLKILSRITDPSRGHVTVRGRLASLLEVGTGFHPDLTGRENIFLNGAILGMTRAEIQSKFDEIVGFSEIGKFLDTPVKRYSSGMYVRLAFAVAAHLEPEILLIDEVLAVGDLAFQKKCLGKMGEVSKAGRTVFFVSHNMAAVENLCQTGIVLNEGRLAFCGGAKNAIEYYVHSVFGVGPKGGSHALDVTRSPRRSPKHRPLLQRLEFFTEGGQPVNGHLPYGAPLRIHIRFHLDRPVENLEALFSFNTLLGDVIFVANSAFEPSRAAIESAGEHTYVCNITSLTLVPGEYMMNFALGVGDGKPIDLVEDAARISILPCDFYRTGRVPKYGTSVLPHRWLLNADAEDELVEATAGLDNDAT